VGVVGDVRSDLVELGARELGRLGRYRPLDRGQEVGARDALRLRHLGAHRCASTVICCRLLEPRWKLEVEAMAAT